MEWITHKVRRSALVALIALYGAVLVVSGIGRMATASANAQQTSPLFCRIGYTSAVRPITDYGSAIDGLRAGSYLLWAPEVAPARPNGMEAVQIIGVKQWKWRNNQYVLTDATAPYATPYTYTVRPGLDAVRAAVLANPGAIWLIGNEIERRDYLVSDGQTSLGQDEILPEVYAWAYHDLYVFIKSLDPTAQVGIGGMIQATPLRLKYLERAWNKYIELYGVSLPADVWNIHAYALPEWRQGAFPPPNDWKTFGADIPAGLSEIEGLTFPDYETAVLADKSFDLAATYLRAFRRWMYDHGQQNKPLIVSEAGVHMPEWVAVTINGKVVYPFMPEDIRDSYMYPMFNFAQNVTDTVLGYPADGYRLTQRWIWYSLDGDAGSWDEGVFYQYFGSNLFYSGKNGGKAMGIAPLGTYWQAYVNNPISMPVTVDLRPVQVWTEQVWTVPPGTVWDGTPVTVTVYVRVANSGNLNGTQPFSVTLQNLDDNSTLGQPVVSSLGGCGQTAVVTATWANLGLGTHGVSVTVDSGNAIAELDENNNTMQGFALVASYRTFLPLVFRN
jgi:hypothetical protein